MAGFRSLLGFWLGGLSAPSVAAATFVAGAIRIFPAISITGAEIVSAVDGTIEVKPATGGGPRMRRS